MASAEINLDMEDVCLKCNDGKRYLPGGYEEVKCSVCDGTGWVTTELGEAVLRLLARRGFIPKDAVK